MSVQEWPLKHIQTDSAKIEEKEKKKRKETNREKLRIQRVSIRRKIKADKVKKERRGGIKNT